MRLITKDEQNFLEKMRLINKARKYIKDLIADVNNGYEKIPYRIGYDNVLFLIKPYFKRRGYKVRVSLNCDYLIIK